MYIIKGKNIKTKEIYYIILILIYNNYLIILYLNLKYYN